MCGDSEVCGDSGVCGGSGFCGGSGACGEPLGAEPAALGSDGITALPSAGPDWSRISRLTSEVCLDTTRRG
ncbi:hypothetical protein GCM10009872_01080 [Actinopolymorpha rutila]